MRSSLAIVPPSASTSFSKPHISRARAHTHNLHYTQVSGSIHRSRLQTTVYHTDCSHRALSADIWRRLDVELGLTHKRFSMLDTPHEMRCWSYSGGHGTLTVRCCFDGSNQACPLISCYKAVWWGNAEIAADRWLGALPILYWKLIQSQHSYSGEKQAC